MSQKLRIAWKKSIRQKNERQVNSNLPCKFGYFSSKMNFLGAHNAPFELQQHPNVIWCVMKFYAYHFFSTLRIFYVDMVTSEGGGSAYS